MMFVALEGPDGCGKSTQASLITEALCARGIKAVATFEPTKEGIGKYARDAVSRGDVDPIALAHLFIADRIQHVRNLNETAKDSVVICDRYMLSTLVYQGIDVSTKYSMPIPMAVALLLSMSTAVEEPNLTFYFNASVASLQPRIAQRGQADRFEAGELQRRVHETYQTVLSAQHKFSRSVQTINAEQSPEAVTVQCVEAIIKSMKGKR